MAPSFIKLKIVSKKVEAKLNKVMYKLHMKKTANKAEAAVEVEFINTVTNAEQGNTTKPKPAVVDQGKTNMPNTAGKTKVVDKEQSLTPEPTPAGADQGTTMKPQVAVETEVINKQQGTTTKLVLTSDDQNTATITPKTAIKAEVTNTLQGKSTKPMHTAEDQVSPANKPDPASKAGEESATTADLNKKGADGVQNSSSTNSQNSNKKLEKKAKRAARREARKAKWAAKRAALKTKSIKFVDAAIMPVAIVSCILCSPLICAADIVFTVIQGVVLLIIRIVDFMCAPVFLCILCRKIKVSLLN